MSVPFLGEDRHQIVNGLAADFDAVARDEGPRMVVLSSPPGWGKTRIVQEFYGRLATERQGDGPHYWPHQMLDESLIQPPQGATPLSAARKVVYPAPPFVVEANATMPWMWWGISCRQRHQQGGAEFTLDEAARQMVTHAADLSRDPIDGKGGRLYDGVGVLANLLAVVGVGALDFLTGGVTGLVLGGAKATWDNRDLQQRLTDLRERRHGQREGRLIMGEAPVDPDEELIASIERLSRGRPLVMVVDDAHNAERRVVHLVNGLLRRTTARVLVIATGHPGKIDVADAQHLQFGATVRRYLDAAPHTARQHKLTQLDVEDARELITSQLPAAAPVAEQLIARHGTNPLVLRALLQLPRLIDIAAQGPLEPEDLDGLPTTLDEIYAEHWAHLPGPVRMVLGLAAQLRDERYVVGALVRAESEHTAHVADSLDQAVAPHAWARPIDELVHTFIEPLLYRTARHKGADAVTRHQIARLHRAIVDMAIDIDRVELTPEARRTLLAQHVGLASDATITTVAADATAVRSAHLLARDRAAQYDYAEAITLARMALEWGDAEDLDVRHNLARWLAESGQLPEAITQFTALLTDQTRILGPDHPDTLRTRHNLAYWLGESGQLTEAITQYTALLTDQTRILGPDHPDTLTTRSNLAYWLGQSGQHTEAITQFTALLTDETRILGPDHPDTLTTRNNLAYWLGESGQLPEAITQFTALLTDETRILGPDHPDTLTTRNNLAYWLGESGQLPEAITQFTALLADQTRILGPDHPDTLTVRGNLAFLLGESGTIGEAVGRFANLEADCLRFLGPDHPLTRSVSRALNRLRAGENGGV